jgi:hypothetical protein
MKARLPRKYQEVSDWMREKKDPRELLNQKVKQMTPQQKQAFLNGANNMGVPQNILSELQNLK